MKVPTNQVQLFDELGYWGPLPSGAGVGDFAPLFDSLSFLVDLDLDHCAFVHESGYEVHGYGQHSPDPVLEKSHAFGDLSGTCQQPCA